MLLGDVFAAFNPWRAAARGAAWLYARARRGGEPPAPMAYPPWLGRWPAALGILAFAWVELVYVNKDDPSQLATMALLYAAVQLVGMSLYGIERVVAQRATRSACTSACSRCSRRCTGARARSTCARRWPARPPLDAGPGTVRCCAR